MHNEHVILRSHGKVSVRIVEQRDAHPQLIWQIADKPRVPEELLDGDAALCVCHEYSLQEIFALGRDGQIAGPCIAGTLNVGDDRWNIARIARVIEWIRPH
jgi:hypothetical protein